MKLIYEERVFNCGDFSASLKVHQPSAPHGGWPGNTTVIRVWSRGHKGKPGRTRATEAEARELERMLGELSEVAFVDHPTLGKAVRG